MSLGERSLDVSPRRGAVLLGKARAPWITRAAIAVAAASCALAQAVPVSAQEAKPPGASTPAQGAPPPAAQTPQPGGAAAPPPYYPYSYPPHPYAYGPPEPKKDYTTAGIEEQMRAVKQRLRAAKDADDDAEVERLESELDSLKEAYEIQRKQDPRYSGGMMAGGIVLSCLGGVGLLVGAGLMLSGKDSDNTAGYITFGASVAAVGGGVALAIVGGRRVSPEEASAAAQPRLFVGPQGAALRVSF